MATSEFRIPETSSPDYTEVEGYAPFPSTYKWLTAASATASRCPVCYNLLRSWSLPQRGLRDSTHHIEISSTAMTIYGVLRRIVRNDAIRVDPPEVYNWRVLALAASVCVILMRFRCDVILHTTNFCVQQIYVGCILTLCRLGMFRRHDVWYGRRHYRRGLSHARFQKVLSCPCIKDSHHLNSANIEVSGNLVLINSQQAPLPICPVTSSLLCKQAQLQEP